MQKTHTEKSNVYPIIRPGNQLIQLVNGNFYIGSARRGVCFSEVERYRFLQYCDGKRDLLDISKIIGSELSVLNQYLFDGVLNKYLIKFLQSTSKSTPNSEIGSFGSSTSEDLPTLKTRRDCEYDFYLRKDTTAQQIHLASNLKVNPIIKFTPAELFNNRSKQEILIFGANYFTVQLLANLQAAGFSSSKVIGSFGKDHSQIIADDLAGSIIQSSDVGSTITQISKRISREHQLVNIGNYQSNKNANPALIIAMQPIPADYQQRWLSESTPHFVIGAVSDNQIEIGPIVLPGQTTCLRCIDLTSVSNALAPEIATLNYLNSLERLPAAALAILVGMITIFTAEFLDTQSAPFHHSLISSALRVDLANPCKQAHIKWQPNPMCGCGADLAQYANGRVG